MAGGFGGITAGEPAFIAAFERADARDS